MKYRLNAALLSEIFPDVCMYVCMKNLPLVEIESEVNATYEYFAIALKGARAYSRMILHMPDFTSQSRAKKKSSQLGVKVLAAKAH